MTEGHGHTLTGDIQHHAQFASRILKNQRDIWVYLPPGYRRSTSRRYPVFYLHDGQNVFDAATAFGGTEWNADETAEELINRRLIEPLIIVAVGSAGEDRIHEYTPTNGRLEPNGGLRRQESRFTSSLRAFSCRRIKALYRSNLSHPPRQGFDRSRWFVFGWTCFLDLELLVS